jgi:uncharacterized protein (TIGR02284 family)
MTDHLERITQLLVDSQRGYSEAAEIADDPHIAQMFASRASRRAALAAEFASVLPRVDADDGTAAGTAHRMFVNLRRLVQDDTRVALGEVERGESAFEEALDRALDDTQLTGQARAAISRLHDEVRSDRDQFAALKEAY